MVTETETTDTETPRQRVVDTHHDGHGLNESIAIRADAPSNGNASHRYEFYIGDVLVGFEQFQQGPRNEPDSTPGLTEAAVLAAMIDRLQGFQGGPYACRENAIIITKLEECLLWTKVRADARAKRGVLGKAVK